MKERIELLVSLGLTNDQAEAFCRDTYYEGHAHTSVEGIDFRDDYYVTPFSELIK